MSVSDFIILNYMKNVPKEWKTRMGRPILIADDQLFSLSFADDQMIFAQYDYDLEFMVRRLYKEHKKWDFIVNFSKTEYLVVSFYPV